VGSSRRGVAAVGQRRVALDRRRAGEDVEIGRAEQGQLPGGDLVGIVDGIAPGVPEGRDRADGRGCGRGCGRAGRLRGGGRRGRARAAAQAGQDRDHGEEREGHQVGGDESAEPAQPRLRPEAPAEEHECDSARAGQRGRDQPGPEPAAGRGGGGAHPEPAEQAGSPGHAEHDDGDHGQRGQDAEQCFPVQPAARPGPQEPLAPLAERVVGPVGEQHREGQVGHEDVAALEPLIAEEGQVEQQVAGGRVAAEREHDPDQGQDVPHDPLGRP
jgi:hypothetical protein